MSTKENIENLFASEDLDSVPKNTGNPELPKIDAGIEKRQFTRVDIGEKKVGVRFNNQLQFARQYIENISLGGLFVKTLDKYEMGQIVTMEFKIPHPDRDYEEISFLLKASVCRITKDGVGLEFTNLTQENRSFLENYVRSVLPKGAEVKPKPKQAIIERVEELRKQKLLSQEKRKRLLMKLFVVVALLAVNFGLLRQSVKEFRAPPTTKDQQISIGEQQVDLNKIKSIVQKENGEVWIQHSEGEISLDKIHDQSTLPMHIRHQANIVKSVSPAKEIRRSKNASGYINTRP